MQTDGKPRPLAEGTFSKTPFSHILVYLLGKELGGTLEIQHQNDLISVYFRKGMPAKVQSTLKGKALGQILLDARKITHDQLLACQKEMAVSGGFQGQILMRQGSISAATLVGGLRRQMVMKLLDIFPMHDASYAFYGSVNLLVGQGPDELFPLDTFALLLAGARAHSAKMRLGSVLDTLQGRWFYLDSAENLQRFKFNKQERDFCRELLVERKTMDQVIQEGVYSRSTIRSVVYVLMLTKVLRVAETPGPAARPSMPPPPESMAFDSITPPPSDVAESSDPAVTALRKRVKEKASQIAGQNYFEMLEVPLGAPAEEVRRAFFKLAKEFHPDRASQGELMDLREALEYIFSNMSEAHSTLIDPDAREEYGEAISDGIKRTSVMPGPNDEAEVHDVLSAENCYQKALVLLRREQKEKALDLIDRARELNPKEGEYLGLWAHLQAQQRSPGTSMDDLLSHMRRAEELNPKSERIHLYFAHLLMRSDRQAEAKLQFQKVIEVNPRNIEAQRELRIMELRRSNEAKKKGFLNNLFNK